MTNQDEYPQDDKDKQPSWFEKPLNIAIIMVVVIGLFYLLREHWGHITGFWPYLLLMLCPLMHIFMGHGGHGGNTKGSPSGK